MLYSGYQCRMVVSNNQIDFHFTPNLHEYNIDLAFKSIRYRVEPD
ncbi:hypothetical protein C7S16_5883 [Burkholderia thailandensis]|uniref:Uncharacterized protein n=1 Tax=Burkholderia thailandensis TaxID=57975 RepID=A0AAW9CVT6_BURTH|nr:hypothetical protein [Burkholderia thailandensis]MDW9253143.1 hypothetical protein [Burkholderia thailandensis]